MNKLTRVAVSSMVLLVMAVFVPLASAHVVVKPASVGVAERVDFTVNVPTEKEVPTTQVRLVLPEELQSVRPLVKQGWNVELVRSEDEMVTEIIWSGGTIPADQKDMFAFSSQAPAEETELVWKAYQTYADGEVVAWEHAPGEGGHGDEDNKPYSVTTVTDDLNASQNEVQEENMSPNDNAMTLSIIAVLFSGAALGMQLFKKNSRSK